MPSSTTAVGPFGGARNTHKDLGYDKQTPLTKARRVSSRPSTSNADVNPRRRPQPPANEKKFLRGREVRLSHLHRPATVYGAYMYYMAGQNNARRLSDRDRRAKSIDIQENASQLKQYSRDDPRANGMIRHRDYARSATKLRKRETGVEQGENTDSKYGEQRNRIQAKNHPSGRARRINSVSESPYLRSQRQTACNQGLRAEVKPREWNHSTKPDPSNRLNFFMQELEALTTQVFGNISGEDVSSPAVGE